MSGRISDKRLGEIEMTLSQQDREILETFRQLRYLKANQVERLFFHRSITVRAKLVTVSRRLNRLMEDGLLNHYSKKVSGARSGSNGYVWYLTEAGYRILNLGTGAESKRLRGHEPSSAFLRHTLAVSECYTQFTEICRMAQDMELKYIAVEPECWRSYHKDGKAQSLRPDLYAETISGQFEDRWFIEMDLDTESVNDIVTKCRRYQYYYQTRKEQESSGIFPIVLWIVPNQERKGKLIDAIRFNFGKRYPHINLVITPNELWNTLIEGAKKEDLC